MKQLDLTYRITKIGGRAVSVAVCALTGMMFMGGAMAQTTIPTGTSIPAVQDIGGNPAFNIQSASIDALGVTTYHNYVDNSTAASAWSPITTYNNAITLQSGNKITGRTLQDGSTYAGVYSQNTIQQNSNDTTYNYTSLAGATFNVQGNNIVNGAVGLNFTNWGGYANTVDPLAVVNLNGYNVTFGNAVYAANTYIKAGTNNTVNNDFSFYGTLNSNLTFNQAASVLLNGGLSGFAAQALPISINANTANGDLNFNGFNSYVTLGANQGITGNVTTSGVNGVLIFQGAGNVNGTVGSASSTLKEVRTNGTGNVLFNNTTQQAYVDYVNYQAATLVGFNGGLNLTLDQSGQAKNQVAFNNNDGVLQIGNNGSLTGKAGTVVVSTTGNNLGTVTMVSGTQAITGGIGASGHAIKTLNIGGNNTGGLDTSTANYSTTTANGDIYAQNINLNNNGTTNSSSLIMASGYNLTGTVNTDTNQSGILTLAGGTQTVTGTVGATGARLSQVNSGATGANSTFTGAVFADTVTNNTGTGSSTFNSNVTATTAINVNAGTTLVSGAATVDGTGGQINVTSGSLTVTGATSLTGTAASINVGSGAATFNGTTSITTGDVNFTGNGTVNFNQAASFTNLNYAGNAGIVNVASGKNITATAITTTTNGTGTLNMLGGTQTVNATVGANTLGLNLVTAGADSATTNFTNTAAVYANKLEVTGNGAVNLSGGLVGNLSYTNNVASENGTVTVAAGKDVIGTVTTGSNGVNNAGSQGILTMAGGTQQVSGAIGSSTAALKTINAGVASATTSLNGMVYADTVLFSSNGTVVLNGTNSGNAIGGLKGTANLNSGSGTLRIGDAVKLTTGAAGIQFANANNATLTFDGSSTVTGVVGGNTAGNSTFNTINAGAAGKLVTFSNDMTVGTGNLNVSGTGEVDLNGNLNGALSYNADGLVKVADGKSISGVVTTATTNTGTLNYLGGTTLNADIGTSGLKLKAVNFNTATNNVTQDISHNVYATDVTIGGTTGTTATSLQNATGVYDYAGATQVSIFTGGTTANINNVGSTGAIAIGGNLNIANATTAVNFGIAHVNVAGNVVTNGGAMSFTVNTNDITNAGTVANNSVSAGSGQVAATGALTMTGAEKVQVNYVGSLANAGAYTLIATGSGAGAFDLGNETAGKVSDNSFSIDTSVRQATAADVTALRATRVSDLIVVADRTAGATYAANQNYIQKAGTVGDYTNNAGIVLGGIAAAGTQTGDMVKVIQMLEIDSFGYGNSAANLATQVKRLAPVANASVTRSALAASGLSLNALGVRMSALRGGTQVSSNDAVQSGLSSGDAVINSGVWLKALGSTTSQNKQDAYDGYSAKLSGLAVGADKQVSSDLVLGLALGLTRADVDQEDFRSGDTTRINNTQLMGYGTYDITPALYVEGALSYARNTYANKRAAAVGRTATADFNGTQLGARIGLGYGIDLGNKTKITPMASVDFTHLNQDAYTETGAGAINLNVASQSANNTRFGLGARLTRDYDAGTTTYRPEVSLNWYQDSNAANNDVVSSFVGGGSSFVTPGASSSNRSSVNVGLALTVVSNKTTSIQVRYDLDKSSGYTAQTGSLVARWEY